MKFSHEEVHIWTQYALCLISMGRYMHAYRVLKVVARLSPQKVMPCLLAARLCYEQLNMVNKPYFSFISLIYTSHLYLK